MFPFLNKEFTSLKLHFDLELEVFVPMLVIALGTRLRENFATDIKGMLKSLWERNWIYFQKIHTFVFLISHVE